MLKNPPPQIIITNLNKIYHTIEFLKFVDNTMPKEILFEAGPTRV